MAWKGEKEEGIQHAGAMTKANRKNSLSFGVPADLYLEDRPAVGF